jgi:hypothetical protein
MSDTLALINAMKDLNNTLKSKVSTQSRSNTDTLASSVFSPEDIERQNNFLREQAKIFEDLKMNQEEQEAFYKRSGSYLEDLNDEFKKTRKASTLLSKSFGDFLNKVLGGYPAKLKKMTASAVESIRKIGNVKSSMIKGFRSSMKELKAINAYANKAGGGAAMKASMFTKLLGAGFSKVLGPIGMGLKMLGGTMISVFVTGIKYGVKFVKFMTALPLAITASAAKIGNSLRSDIVETIGTAAEALQDTFSFEGNLGKGLQLMHGAAKDSLLAAKDVRGEFVGLFGYGAAGAANMLNEVGQGLSGMAQFADTVGHSITVSKESFVEFYKATKILGMGAEEIKYFAMESMKNLTPINQTLDSLGQSLKVTAKSFSVDLKLLSKNFFQLRKDIINFGHLSDLQLTETSAKLTQMGVSADQALAVFNKFQTFEDAAQSAALLSQTFGMNVDALQMIKAEKPEEIIEMFRDSMYMTGRTFDEMNRHEKGVLAQYTGMSAEALNMIMNFRDMNMSYEEIQEKMKETDPQQMQIKSLQGMESALKQVKKTITGESFFKKFFDGISNSIVLGTDFQKTFFRASEVMEEFFLEGLRITNDPKVKSAIDDMLSPFKVAIEEVVGDGTAKNKGIFDAKIIGKSVAGFAKDMGPIIAGIFNKTSTIAQSRNSFSSLLSNTFDPKTLLQEGPTTPVGKLIQTSGAFIGKFLKVFAALGPELIVTVGESIRNLVDWLTSTGSPGFGISDTMRKFFQLTPEDGVAIADSINVLFREGGKTLGAIGNLFIFIQKKFIGLVAEVTPLLVDMLKSAFAGAFEGTVFESDEMEQTNLLRKERAKKSNKLGENKSTMFNKIDLQTIRNEGMTMVNDQWQIEYNAQLIAALEKSSDSATAVNKKLIKESLDQIKRANLGQGNEFYDLFETQNLEKTKKLVAGLKASGLFDETATGYMDRSIGERVKKQKADDWFSDLFGGGTSVMQSAGGGNYSLTSLNPGDQILAGMKDGPLVNAIRYSGDIAGSIAKVFAGLGTASGSKEVVAESGTTSTKPIEVTLMIDKEKLTTVLLSNDLIGKGGRYEYTRGATRLQHNALQNPAGGSTEGSALG